MSSFTKSITKLNISRMLIEMRESVCPDWDRRELRHQQREDV